MNHERSWPHARSTGSRIDQHRRSGSDLEKAVSQHPPDGALRSDNHSELDGGEGVAPACHVATVTAL